MYIINEEDYKIIQQSIEDCNIILERLATIDINNNVYFDRFKVSNDELFAINEAVNQVGIIFDKFGKDEGGVA